MAQRKKNSVVLNVRISPEDRDELRRLAEADDRSVGGVVRLAIRKYLAVREGAESLRRS
jgi:predicted transcriptional regulator